MTAALPRVRLYLLGGAVLVFLGGLLVAIGQWNRVETDRAFVEAAALAARAPPPPGGVRYWAPADSGLPDPSVRVRIEAAERLRQAPVLPALPPIQVPALTSRPFQPPRSAPLPTEKPPAAPR
ncbi:hypothetical protein [Neoroseomonas soli]|uniref:Uncharacterized protein n=1 Tax=Neoroseomonas soli TaxID=1081025 RepID=A0A9X9WTF8_9PROT|nr:hypothetical protein [Neoroseomonas soli]MBR0670437.1 hypothetical protein [Neoroseomonas soli]